jgi:hypothetical protein
MRCFDGTDQIDPSVDSSHAPGMNSTLDRVGTEAGVKKLLEGNGAVLPPGKGGDGARGLRRERGQRPNRRTPRACVGI